MEEIDACQDTLLITYISNKQAHSQFTATVVLSMILLSVVSFSCGQPQSQNIKWKTQEMYN